jgi:uncharacterized protein (DUF1499 family)
VPGIQVSFALATSAALAAIIGGLALALLLPGRDNRSTVIATGLAWLFRAAVVFVFIVTIAFLAVRAAPGLGARADPVKLLGLAGIGAFVAVMLGFVWAAAQPQGASRPGLLSALMGVAMGICAAYVPITWRVAADTLPRLNDVTTDTLRPPAFVALLAHRRDAASSADYPGEAAAAAQRLGYPDIGPVVLREPPADAFAHVERVVAEMGWDVVAREPAQGRLEAVATTLWFGFRDDIVVRLTAVPEGTRIDIRSRSRLGISDLGTNAARIRIFLSRLQVGA